MCKLRNGSNDDSKQVFVDGVSSVLTRPVSIHVVYILYYVLNFCQLHVDV